MMRHPTHLRLTLLLSFLQFTASPGAVILYEDFEGISTTELQGYAGTPGISGSWAANTAITEIESAPPDMEVTLPTGEYISGGSQSLEVTGNNNSAISVNLESPLVDEFYVSFLIQMESGTVNNNDFATLWFGEGTFVGAPAVGIKAQLGPGNSDLMGRISGNQEAYTVDQLGIGATYYLVAKVSKTNGSLTYSQVDFWVNPGSNEEATPQATSTGTISFDEFQTLGIRTVNLDPDDTIYFDNFTVATEWNDVVPPVPEPQGAISLALAVITLCLSRKRKLS